MKTGRVQGLRYHPDPILYRVAREVTPDDWQSGYAEEVEADLHATAAVLHGLTGKRCLGLAAPQIGHPVRVFVLAQWPRAFCNPTCEYVPGKATTENETCFSLPDVMVPVTRSAKLRIRYQLFDGQERAGKLRDQDARVFQHELDHLDGVTILHRADQSPDLPMGFAKFG